MDFSQTDNGEFSNLRANSVVLTDLPKFVPLLEEGIVLNSEQLGNRVTARPLSWGSAEDVEGLEVTPDLILVSDCLYYEASVTPLISTLRDLCAKKQGCFVLLSYEVRDDYDDK